MLIHRRVSVWSARATRSRRVGWGTSALLHVMLQPPGLPHSSQRAPSSAALDSASSSSLALCSAAAGLNGIVLPSPSSGASWSLQFPSFWWAQGAGGGRCANGCGRPPSHSSPPASAVYPCGSGRQSPGCTAVLMYTAVLSLLYWCSSPVTTLRQLYLMYSDVHMYIFDVL